MLDYRTQIENLRETGSIRQLRPLTGREGCHVEYNGVRLVNMTSNDYLGIAGDKGIHEEFYNGLTQENLLDNFGLGSASSRLLTGDCTVSHMLEDCIRKEYTRPACLLFNSGYHANIGILPSLTGKNDLILSDKLNHASIIDGSRLSRAKFKRFRHLDYEHLSSLLENKRKDYERVIIITESVFSMDGDEADLETLVKIKNNFDCMLYVDEAHSVGVSGNKGLGKAEEHDLIEEIDLLVGTFGKAYASVGAFLVCSEDIRNYLINFSRSLIFTTALSPVILSWNHFIFMKVLEMRERRQKLHSLSNLLRNSLISQDLVTAGTTNIVPVIIGDNLQSVQLAVEMQKKGFLVFTIRPPTVPEGSARFRLSLTANMEWKDIENLPMHIRNGIER